MYIMRSKILIIEDDRRIADMLTVFLQALGYDVVSAYNGMDGLSLYAEAHPNLILLDMMLPDINGLDISHYLRETDNIPIIFMSAFQDYGRVVQQLQMEQIEFVTKPFRFEELSGHIRYYLT